MFWAVDKKIEGANPAIQSSDFAGECYGCYSRNQPALSCRPINIYRSSQHEAMKAFPGPGFFTCLAKTPIGTLCCNHLI